jgi:hypothetical protein
VTSGRIPRRGEVKARLSSVKRDKPPSPRLTVNVDDLVGRLRAGLDTQDIRDLVLLLSATRPIIALFKERLQREPGRERPDRTAGLSADML